MLICHSRSLADSVTKTPEDGSSKSSGTSEGATLGVSEPEVTVVDEKCTSSFKGTLRVFLLLIIEFLWMQLK